MTSVATPLLPTSSRVLIVDDNPAIHGDFKKVLTVAQDDGLAGLEADLFGSASAPAEAARLTFELDGALQGKEALERVTAAVQAGRPYAIAFVDVRMPPGWDGIETISHLWQVDPQLQVVLCSAYSDYDWAAITAKLGVSDRLLILKKPFDNVEVLQMAHALAHKWALDRELRQRMNDLEVRVAQRTAELEEKNAALVREASARERAEQRLRLMERMSATANLANGLAHEINNPLSVVTSTLPYLEQQLNAACSLAMRSVPAAVAEQLRPVQEELGAAFSDVKEAVGRVSSIVRVARDFAAADTATVSARTDIAPALKATVAIARTSLRDIAIDVECAANAPEVVCRVAAVNQVVHDLIDNAAQAIVEARREAGAIAVRLERDDDGVVISIADNGCGINDAIRSEVFDPLFSTRNRQGNVGRGLAAAHAVVVEQHGGRIHFESTAGVGTCFFIHLPSDGAATAPVG